jgi:FKBP-type peptidyl-prolyl cis-trans isomerase
MINKFEAIGIFVCVGIMSIALFLMRLDSSDGVLSAIEGETEVASVIAANGEDKDQALAQTLANSMNSVGDLKNIVSEDVVEGEGAEVKNGDLVSVHYIGTLQNGQQFDNSYVKGQPYTFTVGKGDVIKGWDLGLVGMKVGGQRILVIPPEYAYGKDGMYPIPGNATLVFSVELIEIK